ncbi:MAG: PP2C family protein-serine/threonine phosphatase [Planctomycetota bacterium]
MGATTRCLWLGGEPIPSNVCDAARGIGEFTAYREGEPLHQQLKEASLAVVCPDGKGDNPNWFAELLNELQECPVVAVFLLPTDTEATRQLLERYPGQFVCAAKDATPEQIAAHLSAAMAVQPVISKLHDDLSVARNLSSEATRTIEQMDQEMRLAARLQRDFLPRRLPEVGPAHFGVLYRPANWVSGDIYDIVRLDETHVGFYVADVVGHGMPAALLTMFVKKSLQTKRIVGHSYEIVPPHITLKELNTDICEQNLQNCQFCTAVYCVLDTESLILTFARGGHPEPIVIHHDGQVERLWLEGSLLGIFPHEEYQSSQYQLQSGDRLLLYTDGAEQSLCRQRTGEMLPIEESLSRLGDFSREEMLLQLTALADSRPPDSPPDDDITVLVLDIEA